jgi:Fe-S-cluster containining protein
MWQQLKDGVRNRQKVLDEEIERWIAAYRRQGGRIYCREGCRHCCDLAVHATLSEALLVAEALSDGQRRTLHGHVTSRLSGLAGIRDLKIYLRTHRQQVGYCPFLEQDGRCGIYAVRPFSCRALLSTRPGEWCGTDFSTLHPLEKEAFLGSLDRSVVDFPGHYVAEAKDFGLEMEAATRWDMRETFGFSLTGNLALLVHLQGIHDLAGLAGRGPEAISEFFQARNLSQSPLVCLSTGSGEMC